MHDDTQNQERNKAEKRFQRGKSLKACTQNEWRFVNYKPSKIIFRFSMAMQCMMMHVYLPERYRSPFLLPGLPFLGFEPLDLMASHFCLLKPQLVILTIGDDWFSISTYPPSLTQILWKVIVESTSWFDDFSLLHTQTATCWFWPLQVIDFPYQHTPRVWSKFFEKELWS